MRSGTRGIEISAQHDVDPTAYNGPRSARERVHGTRGILELVSGERRHADRWPLDFFAWRGDAAHYESLFALGCRRVRGGLSNTNKAKPPQEAQPYVLPQIKAHGGVAAVLIMMAIVSGLGAAVTAILAREVGEVPEGRSIDEANDSASQDQTRAEAGAVPLPPCLTLIATSVTIPRMRLLIVRTLAPRFPQTWITLTTRRFGNDRRRRRCG